MKKRILSIFCVLFLFLNCFNLLQIKAQEQDPIVYRGDCFVDINYGNGTHLWESAPQFVFNGSQYVPYIYYRDESKKNHVIQSGLISAKIYDTGVAKFFDPDLIEERVKSEIWEVWRLDKNEWKKASVSSTIIFNIIQEQNYIILETKRNTSKPDGILTIQYLFSEGNPLKHNVYWESYSKSIETTQIRQVWDLKLSSNKVFLDNGSISTTSIKTNSTTYIFGDDENDFLVRESQWSATYYPNGTLRERERFIDADIDFSGKKVIFTFGNWTLAQGEYLEIDPITFTSNNPTQDGDIERGGWTRSTGLVLLRAQQHPSNPNSDKNAYIEWSISGIPDGSDVTDTDFICHEFHSGRSNVDIYSMESRPSTSGNQVVFNDVEDGTVFYANWAFTGSNNKVLDLGAAGDNDVESQLGVNWFAIGLWADSKNSQYSGCWAEEYGSANPKPTLRIVYTLPNAPPTITSASISDRDDGDNCYEMESYYSFVAVVNDGDGADDIAKVYLRGTQAGAVRFEVRATTLDGVPAYAIQTGANIIDLDTGSCSWAEAGDQGTATFLIRFEWDFTDEANLEIFVYVEDTSAASAGFTEMQTNYFDVIGRLVTIDLAVDDGRINLGGTATFSGKVKYATTVGGDVASAKYPLDGQFTAVHIHNAAHVSQGNDNTIVNGEFSGISFAIPSAIQSNTYHVYLDLVADYSDGDAPDGDTVAVIGDRIRILTLTANVTLLEVWEYAQLRLTAELEFDNHPLGPGDFVEINGTAFAWDAGDVRFEVDVTSGIVQIVAYNLYTDGLEATFVITAGNMNGNSVTLNFTIWPPSDPNLLFGAGFNASIPYVELHWNHSLQGVSVFEIRNSTDGLSWDYLGQSVTTNYTDTLVLNGTERYYRVRACNQTGVDWFNSSFSDMNFETVYFVGAVAGPLAGGGIGFIMLILICSPIIILLVWRTRKR